MSVINKMLRDLDQRHAATPSGATVSKQPRGTHALGSSGGPSVAAMKAGRGRRWIALGAGGAVLLALAAGWLWQNIAVSPDVPRVESRSTAPIAPIAPTAIAVAAVPTATPVAPTVPQIQAAASAGGAAAVVTAQPAATVAAPTGAPPNAPVPTAAGTSGVAARASSKSEVLAQPAKQTLDSAGTREIPLALGLRMDTSLSPRKLAERAAVSERAASPRPEQSPGASANDALERAQALWNAGSRDAALDLLQDAVAVAERQGAGGSFPQGNPVLLPLVRELSRLQLADARHGAVWELLTRLEPQLGTVPDLWAIRGNAAQRLGRHQDSVHAYLVALQSRPNEQRWLLGAAVSLAALGQSGSAADMADKARAVGVVSPDVLAYLRQQGVPLRDK